MPLPKETIRQAILSPDPELRSGAIFFFRHVPGSDPALMPLVIQACEQYGLAAFDSYGFLGGIAQDAPSIDWIRRQIDRWDPDADNMAKEFLRDCINALSENDPGALAPAESILALCQRIDQDFAGTIAGRLSLANLSPDELWQRLADRCAAADQAKEGDFDPDLIFSAVRGLARHPADCRQRTLDILARQSHDWLEVAAAQLAGKLRLEEAVPYLIELLRDFDTSAYDEANFSLGDIGTDAVVQRLAQLFVEDEGLCLEAANLFGDIHTELSAATALQLVGQEQDEDLRLALLRSALDCYAPEAIEPVRQLIIDTPKDPETLELRESLLLVCKMLDARIPEYDEWLADSAHDREFRRRWHRERHELDIDALLEGDEDALLEDGFWADDELSEPDGDEGDGDDAPIVRHDRHIGRNDPCPCGSGKKYKKCCLHKQAIE